MFYIQSGVHIFYLINPSVLYPVRSPQSVFYTDRIFPHPLVCLCLREHFLMTKASSGSGKTGAQTVEWRG